MQQKNNSILVNDDAPLPIRLQALLERLGWAQRELAQHLRVDPGAVSRWMTVPNRRPRAHILREIAKLESLDNLDGKADTAPPRPGEGKPSNVEEFPLKTLTTIQQQNDAILQSIKAQNDVLFVFMNKIVEKLDTIATSNQTLQKKRTA